MLGWGENLFTLTNVNSNVLVLVCQKYFSAGAFEILETERVPFDDFRQVIDAFQKTVGIRERKTVQNLGLPIPERADGFLELRNAGRRHQLIKFK